MRTIGIRARPDDVTFVIYDVDDQAILNIETIKIPKALSDAESLKYVRTNILDILREYEIEKAGIRIIESNSQQKSIKRIQIEGVIQETFASSSLSKYFCGQISTITKLIGINRADFKKYINGVIMFDSVENWADLNDIQREACLAAIGACNA